MAQPAIAAAMGVSLSTVNRAHMAYDHGGIKALKPKPNGGRKHENMTLAEEKPCSHGLPKRPVPARC
jgi:transposase